MPQPHWPPPPGDLRPAAGVVDVWRANLAAAGADRAALHERLSPDERERAARFARVSDGDRWAAGRGILRALLASCLNADPHALRFTEGPHGKPTLPAAPRLRFNLSHSGDVALYAVTLDHEVGIDVELPRRAVDHVALARRVLGEAEAERLAALDPPARERAFLRAWTRWEAVLKCRGTGIGGAEDGGAGTASSAGTPLAASADPWVHELDIGPPGAAALAVAGGPCEVRTWVWQPAVG
jgi:4'-phosphopantetheinyl transferase